MFIITKEKVDKSFVSRFANEEKESRRCDQYLSCLPDTVETEIENDIREIHVKSTPVSMSRRRSYKCLSTTISPAEKVTNIRHIDGRSETFNCMPPSIIRDPDASSFFCDSCSNCGPNDDIVLQTKSNKCHVYKTTLDISYVLLVS